MNFYKERNKVLNSLRNSEGISSAVQNIQLLECSFRRHKTKSETNDTCNPKYNLNERNEKCQKPLTRENRNLDDILFSGE